MLHPISCSYNYPYVRCRRQKNQEAGGGNRAHHWNHPQYNGYYEYQLSRPPLSVDFVATKEGCPEFVTQD
jgi:hypothetical protein